MNAPKKPGHSIRTPEELVRAITEASSHFIWPAAPFPGHMHPFASLEKMVTHTKGALADMCFVLDAIVICPTSISSAQTLGGWV